jgi:ABC-type multidrug transport system fused ATPase/permease subunit
MRLLLKAALLHNRRFRLLLVTFVAMIGVTIASQMEMLSLGVITSSGADFFRLFSTSRQSAAAISREDVDRQWEAIDTDQKGVITLHDAKRSLALRPDRNPLKQLLNHVAARANLVAHLPLLALVLILVALFKGVALFGSQYSKQLVMIRVSRDLRQQYFEHIQQMSLQFYHQYNVGSLSSRVQTDALQIAHGVYSALTTYVQTPIAVVTSLSLCFYVSVRLSLLVFVAFPLLLFPILYVARRVKRAARALLSNNERLNSVLIESLAGIQTVKLFAGEDLSVGKFRRQNDEMAHLEAKAARYAFLARPVLHMSATCMLAAIILYGLYWARLSVSEILIFCGLVYLMYEPIKRLNDENLQIQRGVVAAERMFEVLHLRPQIQDAPGAQPLKELRQQIDYANVGFRYGEEWTLRQVSCTIKKGEMVAIVGPTGGGKSTLVSLLPRLYDPQEGQIFIDGRPLSTYTQQSLRKAIAFVPQRPFFFLDSIAENIAFGGEFSRAEIQAAARRAHADEFIEQLARGYDTILAERGKDLSGGQQQRLALARALVRQSPVLVLDEATSALDALSEYRVKLALSALRGKITQVVIAHRLSTIEDADTIFYVEKGRITARGSRDHLLRECTGFRQMWELLKSGGAPAPDGPPADLPKMEASLG